MPPTKHENQNQTADRPKPVVPHYTGRVDQISLPEPSSIHRLNPKIEGQIKSYKITSDRWNRVLQQITLLQEPPPQPRVASDAARIGKSYPQKRRGL